MSPTATSSAVLPTLVFMSRSPFVPVRARRGARPAEPVPLVAGEYARSTARASSDAGRMARTCVRGPARGTAPAVRRGPRSRRAFLVWVGVAFVAAACWGAVVVLNKRVLDYVHPIPVNFLVLVVSAGSLVVIAVPLSLLHLWPLGFAMTWAAVGYIAVGSAVTWLIAFTAYYYALRSGRVGVVGTLSCTDPLFTAVFAALIVGTAIAGLTIAGLVVAFVGVALISRWMGDEPEPHAPALEGAGEPAPARLGRARSWRSRSSRPRAGASAR